MRKHKWVISFIFGFLILLILLIGYGYITEGKSGEKMVKVSVLLYGNKTERWTSLKQGAEQAGKDYNVVMNYVTTSAENSPTEQVEQINREIQNGAEGLLIAACDSTKLEETVAELVQKIPIVMIETGINNVETVHYLSADNYKMGQTLAETVLEEKTSKRKIAVISENMQRDSVKERSEGFTDTIKDEDLVYWEKSGEFINENNFAKLLSERQVDTVVALDSSTLESLVDVIEKGNLHVALYGIGNTDKIVYSLDKGVINSILFQNEFSIGYLGAKQLYHNITKESDGIIPDISYRIINKNTMYTKENQRLLFPLVQ